MLFFQLRSKTTPFSSEIKKCFEISWYVPEKQMLRIVWYYVLVWLVTTFLETIVLKMRNIDVYWQISGWISADHEGCNKTTRNTNA